MVCSSLLTGALFHGHLYTQDLEPKALASYLALDRAENCMN